MLAAALPEPERRIHNRRTDMSFFSDPRLRGNVLMVVARGDHLDDRARPVEFADRAARTATFHGQYPRGSKRNENRQIVRYPITHR